MNKHLKSIRQHSSHIDKRLRFRMRVYFVIAIILIAILIFNILRGALRPDYGIIGLIIGVGIGIITSRMFHISWDKDAKKIISRLDRFGITIIFLYILLEVFRGQIVGYFTHGAQVGAVGFAVLAGIMFGRVIGARGKIIKILQEQKILG